MEIANQNELDSEWVVQTPKQTNREYYCDQKVHTSFIAAKNLITYYLSSRPTKMPQQLNGSVNAKVLKSVIKCTLKR